MGVADFKSVLGMGQQKGETPLEMADRLGVEELVIDRERWQLVVALDGRRSVRDGGRTMNRLYVLESSPTTIVEMIASRLFGSKWVRSLVTLSLMIATLPSFPLRFRFF